MRYIRLPIFAFIALAFSAAWIPAASAQSPEAQQQSPQQAESFSSKELESFALAALEVQRINESYVPKLQEAKTPDQQEALRQEATGKMVEAIQDKGLSVDKYNQINAAAQANPEVASEISEHMQKAQ